MKATELVDAMWQTLDLSQVCLTPFSPFYLFNLFHLSMFFSYHYDFCAYLLFRAIDIKLIHDHLSIDRQLYEIFYR